MSSGFIILVGSKILSKCLTQYIKHNLSTECIEKDTIVAIAEVLTEEGLGAATKKIRNKLLSKPTLSEKYADVCTLVFNELMKEIKYAKYMNDWFKAVTADESDTSGEDLQESLKEWFSHHTALDSSPEVVIESFVADFNETLDNRIQQEPELFQYIDAIKKSKSLSEILDKIDGLSTQNKTIITLEEEILSKLNEKDCKPTILKKKYLSVPNMLPRKVIPYDYIQDRFVYFYKQEALPLLDWCQKEHRIVLLDDAAAGKTIALKELAAQAYETEYYPCLISLSNYTGETIEEMIQRECGYDPKKDYFLIFDAYDEAMADGRDIFARKINIYSSERENDLIVISARHNFYNYNNSLNKGGTFNDFKEFGLFPLYQEDTTEYLIQNNIDTELFFTQLHERDLTSFLTNPFYLSGMIDIYKKNSILPPNKEIVTEMIRNSFDFDKNKYTNPHIVRESEYELMALLQQAAIAMQLMKNKVYITNNDYSALFNKNNRDLMKHSSLFSKGHDETWSFQHNNFREFLAAEYLNELPVDEIKNVICSDKEHTKVRSSWLNVLSYLALIDEDNELLEWLIDTSPELVVKFEKSRVHEAKRADIFKDIFTYYTERNMYITQGVNSTDELVDFGECLETLDYLITILKTSDSKWCLKSAAIASSHFRYLYSKEDEIREILLSIIESDFDELVQISAVDAIASLKLNTDETTIAVKKMLDKNNSINIAKALVKYIDICGLQDEQLEQLFSIKSCSYIKPEEHYSFYTKVNQVLASVKKSESVKRVLTNMIDSNQRYQNREVLERLIDKAICFYKKGDISYYSFLFLLLLKAIKMQNKDYINIFDSFYKSTETNNKLIDDLIDYYIEKADIIYYLCLYMDASDNKTNIITVLMKRYIKEPDKYRYFVNYFECCKESYLYDDCNAVMKERGDILQKEKKANYESIKQQALQEYVNSLFSKEIYLKQLQTLLASLGDKNITRNDIFDALHNKYNYGTYEWALYHRYVNIVYDKDNDTKVIDYISSIRNWLYFCIGCVTDVLKGNETVGFNENQISTIREYCDSVDIDNLIENGFGESSPMSIHYRYETVFFCFLSQYFDFEYPNEISRKLTCVPSLFFGNDTNEKHFSKYIQNRLTKDELVECVRYNLNNRKLCTYSIVEHIEFCIENNLNYALSTAEELCLAEGVFSGYKITALKYIIKIKNDDSNNYKYIYDKFLNTEDESLIEALINLTADKAAPIFRQRLEELNKHDQNKKKYLKTLIKMQSEYALKAYFEYISQHMSIPELIDIDIDITNEIRNIKSVDLLPTLIHIKNKLFEEGFKDKQVFGLQNSLYYALLNIADNESSKVIESLQNCLKEPKINDQDKAFCNSILNSIADLLERKDDEPWPLRKTKRWLKKNDDLK